MTLASVEQWWATTDDAEAMLRSAADAHVACGAMVLATCALGRVALATAPPEDVADWLRLVDVAEAWGSGRAPYHDVVRLRRSGVYRAPHPKAPPRGVGEQLVAEIARNAARNTAGISSRLGAFAADLAPHVVRAVVRKAMSERLFAALGHLAGDAMARATVRGRIAGAVIVEARRRTTALVREHIPWAALADAYAAMGIR